LKKLVLVVVVVFFAADLFAPPQKQLTARAAQFGIYVYQATYGKLLSRFHLVKCRFTPSCSNYGLMAFKKYGTMKGAALTARRIVRCSPFTSTGGTDLP
jgi:uncharacterized protein